MASVFLRYFESFYFVKWPKSSKFYFPNTRVNANSGFAIAGVHCIWAFFVRLLSLDWTHSREVASGRKGPAAPGIGLSLRWCPPPTINTSALSWDKAHFKPLPCLPTTPPPALDPSHPLTTQPSGASWTLLLQDTTDTNNLKRWKNYTSVLLTKKSISKHYL